jgi:integrase
MADWHEWIRTPADERAVGQGCTFDLQAAQRVAAGSLKGATTDAWSKRLNRARRELAIPHDIHTLRHGFKLAWRACGLPEDQGDAIQGHKNGTVSRTYGSAAGYPLRPLAQSMAKLSFEDA